MWSNTVLSFHYILSIEAKPKGKAGRRNVIRIYANYDQISKHCRGQRSSWREEAKFLVHLYFGFFLAFLYAFWLVCMSRFPLFKLDELLMSVTKPLKNTGH